MNLFRDDTNQMLKARTLMWLAKRVAVLILIGLASCVAPGSDEGSVEQAVVMAPTNLGATVISSTQINLTWDAVPGAAYYVILRGSISGDETTYSYSFGTEFDDGHLSPATQYSWEVEAVIGGEASPPSNEVIVSTQGGIAPPAGVTATAISNSRIQLSWNTVANAAKYYVFQSESGGPFVYINTVTAPGTSYLATGLNAGTMYTFEIESVDANQQPSAPSADASATTFGAIAPPTGVTATAISSSRINVTWNAVSGAVKYYVFQSDSGGPMTYVSSIVAPATSYLATGLTAATTYSYEIQAVDGMDLASTSSTPPASATTFEDGVGARWKFDENGGNTAADSAGGNHTGTLIGSANWGTTNKPPVLDENLHNASYLTVPGASGDGVTVPDDPIFNFADDFTVSLWAYLPSAPTGVVHLMGKRGDACGTTQWELELNGTLHFDGTTSLDFGQGLPVGTWTQVAVSYTAGTATLYINGAQVASGAWSAGPRQAVSLEIGNAGACGNGGSLYLDEVRVYTQALSAQQVSDLGTLPAPPTNVTAMAVSSTEVDVAWDAAPTADLFILYKGTGAGNEQFYTSLSASTTTWDEGHLTAGETSSWELRVVSHGLISNFSNEAIATTFAALAAPTNVTATINMFDPNRIEVSWDAVSGAAKYYVFVSVNGGPYNYLSSVVAPTTTYPHAGLSSGTTYSYEVQTVDAGNSTSPMSAPATVMLP